MSDEPAPRRPTGVGWPGEPSLAAEPSPATQPSPAPQPSSATQPSPPATPQRRDLGTRPDTTVELPRQTRHSSDFASSVRDYRARSAPGRSARPWSPVQPDRPGTVTAAAVILFVGAGLGLLACCGLNVLAGEAALGDSEQNLLMIVSAVIVVFSALNGVLGYYILQGRQWARITTIVVCVLGILSGTVSVFVAAGSDAGSNGVGTCFGIILNAVIIGLLSGSSASDYFRYARG